MESSSFQKKSPIKSLFQYTVNGGLLFSIYLRVIALLVIELLRIKGRAKILTPEITLSIRVDYNSINTYNKNIKNI